MNIDLDTPESRCVQDAEALILSNYALSKLSAHPPTALTRFYDINPFINVPHIAIVLFVLLFLCFCNSGTFMMLFYS